MSEFWLLSDAFKRGALRVSPVDDFNGADVWYGRLTPAQPLRFEIAEGKRLTDFVGSTMLCPPLISDRFKHLLLDGFRGFSTVPCIVANVKNQPIVEGYSALVVSGRCGPILVDRSETVPSEHADGLVIPGQFDHLGVYFDEAEWDGSDIFLPQKGPSRAIITPRLRDAIVSARLTNVYLERCDSKRTPFGYL